MELHSYSGCVPVGQTFRPPRTDKGVCPPAYSIPPRPRPAWHPRNLRVAPNGAIGKLVIGNPIGRLLPNYTIGKDSTDHLDYQQRLP